MGDDVTMEVVVESAGFGGNMIGLPFEYHGIGTFFGQILLTFTLAYCTDIILCCQSGRRGYLTVKMYRNRINNLVGPSTTRT